MFGVLLARDQHERCRAEHRDRRDRFSGSKGSFGWTAAFMVCEVDMTSSVLPSGFAFAAGSAPMPALLSA